MIYLLLSILSSTCILLIFKFIAIRNIPALPVIVINYSVCILCGFIALNNTFFVSAILQKNWFPLACLLGALFIVGFYLMALSVRYAGVTVTSVANKLSLIIPVIAALYLYGDTLNSFKILGILFGIIAIFLLRHKEEISQKSGISMYIILPIVVLISSGMVDTIANYAQKIAVPQNEYTLFLIVVFGMAAIIGWIVLIVNILKRKHALNYKIILGGIALGIPNYGSMYFLIMGLSYSGLQSSVFFPLNNLTVVIFSFIAAIIIFKEQYSKRNIMGLAIAITSIILMAIA
ncbi:MAG: EamA/RhaT family transporter [Bacteroidetes bacterium]|nr:EamA/RhaT family transporter [Bacteroidota bacterium]